MKLRIARITGRSRAKNPAIDALAADYLTRLARYISVEEAEFSTEEALLKESARAGRTAPVLVVLDSRGKQLSSEELANFLNAQLDRGTQTLIFAVGPADGWSAAIRSSAQSAISMGKMTYPHELVRVILAEQLYRAFTIIKGHPYHSGH